MNKETGNLNYAFEVCQKQVLIVAGAFFAVNHQDESENFLFFFTFRGLWGNLLSWHEGKCSR